MTEEQYQDLRNNWNEANGVCLIHLLPQTPCPQCMALCEPLAYSLTELLGGKNDTL